VPRAASLAALLVATAADAEVPGEELARRAFEEGVTLEKQADYAAALAKFRESRDIKPTLGNRFHAAFCLEMTGKIAAALTEYESVEAAAREQNKVDVIDKTRARVEPLRTRVPQLSLHVPGPLPSGLAVTLDGVAVAPALLEGTSFRVEPGRHAVAAVAAGRDPFARELVVPEGGTTTVAIVLAPARVREPDAAASRPAEPAAPPAPDRTDAIATTAIAGSLAVLGVTSFLVAGGLQDDAEKACASRSTCGDEQARVRTFDAFALAGLLGAIGFGALSYVLWTTPTGRARAATAQVRRWPTWAGLEGRF
jgi:hypothetical protein